MRFALLLLCSCAHLDGWPPYDAIVPVHFEGGSPHAQYLCQATEDLSKLNCRAYLNEGCRPVSKILTVSALAFFLAACVYELLLQQRQIAVLKHMENMAARALTSCRQDVVVPAGSPVTLQLVPSAEPCWLLDGGQ